MGRKRCASALSARSRTTRERLGSHCESRAGTRFSNVRAGAVVHPAVAQELGYDPVPLAEILR